MEEIFSKKAWCDPVAVASSTGLSRKQLENNDSMGGSDSGCSISEFILSENFVSMKYCKK